MKKKRFVEKYPVDKDKFFKIILSKYGSKKKASELIGKSDCFFHGQIANGGFDRSTILLVERVLEIPYSEYELKIDSKDLKSEDDLPKNEVVAYAREITRLNNLYRSIYEMVTWLEYREGIMNDAVLRLLENLGVDTTEFEDRLNNDAYYPNRKEIEE